MTFYILESILYDTLNFLFLVSKPFKGIIYYNSIMASDVSIKSYHVKHRVSHLSKLLESAKLIADYAVENKNNKKVLTSKYVKQYNLPSTISNQILRKYGRDILNCANLKTGEVLNMGKQNPNIRKMFF